MKKIWEKKSISISWKLMGWCFNTTLFWFIGWWDNENCLKHTWRKWLLLLFWKLRWGTVYWFISLWFLFMEVYELISWTILPVWFNFNFINADLIYNIRLYVRFRFLLLHITLIWKLFWFRRWRVWLFRTHMNFRTSFDFTFSMNRFLGFTLLKLFIKLF